METVEKLITLLKAADKYAFVKCAEHGSCDECDKLNKGCVNEEKAHYLIQNGVTIQEWVSVDERLPEEEGKYIVCTAKNTVYCAKYHAKGKFFGTDMHTHITHWMPLPKGVQR